VDLTQRLTDAMNRWQAICEADALAAGRDVVPWIFPSEANTPLEAAALYRRFRSLLSRAGLPRFRLYDLRHTFAAMGAGGGLSLPIIGRLLGHTQARTTQRYAHLADDPVREAADKIASAITKAGEGGKVTRLREGT